MQRGVVSLPGPLWARLGLSGLPVGRRGGDRDRCGSGGAAGALLDLDGQTVGFDRQTLFDLQLIVQVIDEVEALQQHAEDEHRFLHGELAADAGPLTGTERLERVRRKLRPGLGPEMVGVVLLGVGAPHARVAVQHDRQSR